MVAAALERGFTYFDTAWTYHDGASEEALRRTLVERYPREAYRLTDKLPTMLVEHAEQQERIFDEQLRRCGVEWFDGYLVHCATAAFSANGAERLGSFDFALRKREEGASAVWASPTTIRPELLDELLTRHPEVDFVQLQISYVDWGGYAHPVAPLPRDRTPPRQADRGDVSAEGAECSPRCRRASSGCSASGVPKPRPRRGPCVSPQASKAWRPCSAACRRWTSCCAMRLSWSTSEPFDRAEYALVERAADLVLEAQPVQCTQCGYCRAGVP